MSEHSAIVGGSNAERLIECPASFQTSLRLPRNLRDIPSVYAQEGTDRHTDMASVFESCQTLDVAAKDLRRLSKDMPHEQAKVINDTWDLLLDLVAQVLPGAKWRGVEILGVEIRAGVKNIPGSFGTCDLVLAYGNTIFIIDFKFGAGVPVLALYTDAELGDKVNAQLLYYGKAALDTHKGMFRGRRRIVLAIVQPRRDTDRLTYTFTTRKELNEFGGVLVDAVIDAISDDPHRARGEHCRFATCKAICPFWTGPMIELSKVDPLKASLRASIAPSPTPYGNFLNEGMRFVEAVEPLIEEIRRQAHSYMEQGGLVPDHKLVPKRATRKWSDPEGTPLALQKLGLPDTTIYTEPEVRSPKQVEDRLPKGMKLPTELVSAISSGTTIALAADARQALPRPQQMQEFAAKVKLALAASGE